MLVLTRKSAETIHIGKDVRITILGIRGERVRLGITAPDAVHIVRQELIERGELPQAPPVTAGRGPTH